MRPVLLLALLLDIVTVAVIGVLLWQHLIPGELGGGLLGAVIGARARWHSDHGGGGSGQALRVGAELREPPILGGRAEHLAREVLDASALGPFLRPVL
jgi:hypothetical protein